MSRHRHRLSTLPRSVFVDAEPKVIRRLPQLWQDEAAVADQSGFGNNFALGFLAHRQRALRAQRREEAYVCWCGL